MLTIIEDPAAGLRLQLLVSTNHHVHACNVVVNARTVGLAGPSHLLKPAHPNDNAFNPICIKQHDDENMPIKNQSDNDSAASISSH